jgi:hypothetical protein
MNRNLTYHDARYILENTADRTGGYDYTANKASGSWSFELGYGRVNAYRAVLAAQSTVGLANNTPKDFTAYVYYDNDGEPYLNVNTDKQATINVALYDVMGRFIDNLYSGTTNKLSNLPVNAQGAGMYLLRVSVNGNSTGIKFVKR